MANIIAVEFPPASEFSDKGKALALVLLNTFANAEISVKMFDHFLSDMAIVINHEIVKRGLSELQLPGTRDEGFMYSYESTGGTFNSLSSLKLDEHQNKTSGKSDFESAIAETGYGKFNLLVMAIAFLCCFANMSDTTVVAFILPRAECDLELTLNDKGALNANTYIGMISSAIMWGFLADVLGRRKILLYGYLSTGVFNVLAGLSQNFWTLIIFKFISGFISCGPFAVLMSYVAEVHGGQHRARSVLSLGSFFASCNVILPNVAWLILPQEWNFVIFPGYFELHSWHIFLIVCSLPGLVGGALVSLLPESPKFLMSRGRNEDAMAVFQHIYRANGNANDYPITVLADENFANKNKSKKDGLKTDIESANYSTTTPIKSRLAPIKAAFRQMKPMFQMPYLRNCILVFIIQFGFLGALNTLRLWSPSLFGFVAEFEKESHGNETFHFCNVLNQNKNTVPLINASAFEDVIGVQDVIDLNCKVTTEGTMYLYSVIVGLTGLGMYILAITVINSIEHKTLLIVGSFGSGIIGLSIYWSSSSEMLVALYSLFLAVAGVSGNALVAMTVTLVPTQLRTMIVSLTMMFGRTGSMIGNAIFPVLLSWGCQSPFFTIGFTLFSCGCLCFLLPGKSIAPLQ